MIHEFNRKGKAVGAATYNFIQQQRQKAAILVWSQPLEKRQRYF